MNQAAGTGLVPAPAPLATELQPWVEALRAAASDACRAVYLHGSALTPRFDPKSDVNLLLVVADLPQSRLDAVARAVAARRAKGGRTVTPLVLTDEQIRRSVDVFPVEFQDLATRRALLWGEDVLAALRVGRHHLRHQCESELRSKLVGLRQAYIVAGGTADLASRLLARAAGGSAAAYRGLLELRGVANPPEAADALTAAVAAAYSVDAAGLAAPFAAHREPPAGDTATAMFAAYVSALDALVAAVDALPSD
jgi:predicted nucleotidyltransferase